MSKPFPLDIKTDETLHTGVITITAETHGDAEALRDLRDRLMLRFGQADPDLYLRGDTRANIPPTVPDTDL